MNMHEWLFHTIKWAIVPVLSIIGQAIPSMDFPWDKVVGTGAPLAVLAFYVWHDVVHARPRYAKEMQQLIKENRDDRKQSKEEEDRQRQRYEAILADQKIDFERRLKEEAAEREAERRQWAESNALVCRFKT